MISRATCPTCGAAFQLSDEQRGQTIACSKCRTVFQTPVIVSGAAPTNAPPAIIDASRWKERPRSGWVVGGLMATVALVVGLAAGVVVGVRLLKPDEAPRAAEAPATKDEVVAALPVTHGDERPHKLSGAVSAAPASRPDYATAPGDSPPPTPTQDPPLPKESLPKAWSDLLKDKDVLVNLHADFPGPGDASQQVARLRASYPAATPEVVHRLYQIKDNAILPQKAIKGRAFAYQLPKLDGAQYALANCSANGLALSPDGLISWQPPLNVGAGIYDLRITLNPGPITRTVKIELAEAPETSLALPHIGGWALLPDGVTLICSLPDQALLVYIDTAANKELKRVRLSFKPELLAVQAKRLFVSVQNASTVHVLDLDSGENKKEIAMTGGGVTEMVCHPDHGPVFIATPNSDRIVYIDPATYATGLTEAPVKLVGLNPSIASVSLAVDPIRADIIYVAYQNLLRRVMNFPNQTPNDTLLVKYLVGGKSLQPVEINQGVAQHGYVVRVSRDGKKVAVSGGAGYISGGGPAGYKADTVGLFAADKLTSVAGVINCGAHPGDLAFHPVLDLGVVEQDSAPYAVRTGHRRYQQITPDQHLHLFNSNSLVEIANITLAGSPFAPEQAGRLLTFGARGTKLLYYDRAQGYLRSFPLTLSDADKAALAKAYTAKGM